MNKFFLGSLLFVVMLSFSISAQDKKDSKDSKNKTATTVVNEKSELNTICPVSKEEADPKITATYNGKTYALCCKTCLKKFNKDPEKYINKMNQNKEEKK